jgi:hypothetical protein
MPIIAIYDPTVRQTRHLATTRREYFGCQLSLNLRRAVRCSGSNLGRRGQSISTVNAPSDRHGCAVTGSGISRDEAAASTRTAIPVVSPIAYPKAVQGEKT